MFAIAGIFIGSLMMWLSSGLEMFLWGIFVIIVGILMEIAGASVIFLIHLGGSTPKEVIKMRAEKEEKENLRKWIEKQKALEAKGKKFEEYKELEEKAK